MTYAGLAAEAAACLSSLDRQAGQLAEIDRQISVTEAGEARLREQAALHARVAGMLTTVGEQAQETARARVEALATKALQVIFGEEHQFLLRPGERGGQATLELVIRSDYPDGAVETGVLSARGGGMAAVISYVLQLVVLLLTPELRNVLWLDESFAHVSASFEPRVAEFLRQVADKARVQHVLVTHSPVYADYADETVRVSLGPDGVSIVQRGESE